MIKAERQDYILKELNKRQIIRVSDITDELNVTEMTIRRDLAELEDKDLLVRVHGGAKLKNELPLTELSHLDKQEINLQEKEYIAKIIANEINNNETVFLGSGTTIELVYDYLTIDHAKIVTNSIFAFNKFKNDPRFELILIGGNYRQKTGAFVGTIANEFLSTIYVQKAFIGVNAIDIDHIYNANEDEGLMQKNVFINSKTKYIVADHTKFNKQDFYKFYDICDADYLITDNLLPKKTYQEYNKILTVINKLPKN